MNFILRCQTFRANDCTNSPVLVTVNPAFWGKFRLGPQLGPQRLQAFPNSSTELKTGWAVTSHHQNRNKKCYKASGPRVFIEQSLLMSFEAEVSAGWLSGMNWKPHESFQIGNCFNAHLSFPVKNKSKLLFSIIHVLVIYRVTDINSISNALKDSIFHYNIKNNFLLLWGSSFINSLHLYWGFVFLF